MKVTIKNLGIIREAEINLKPLTVLIGPNNAGKTWLAYTIAGIFGNYGRREYLQAYIEEKVVEKYALLEDAVEKVLKEGSATINLVEFAEQHGESYFQHVADYSQQWMSDFMSTELATFDTMQVSVNLAESKAAFIEQVKQATLQVNIAGGAFKMSKKQGMPILQAYTSIEGEELLTDKIPPEEIRVSLVRNVARILHQALYSEIQVFPMERAALVTTGLSGSSHSKGTFSEEARVAALQVVRELATMYMTQNMPSVSKKDIGPMGYFRSMFQTIYNIGSKELDKRKRDAQSNPKIQKYMDLAELLEQEILGGNLAFSTPEPNPRRTLLFHPEEHIALELSIASSMVKELSPLVLYLRYLAQPGELLIIDEPEMNLHPEAQAQMIEFLALLVKAGLRVLVTTHSTYIVDNLANLMQVAVHEVKEQEKLVDLFFLEQIDAFISQDDAAAYLIDDGTAENILHDSIINWRTFSAISDWVSNIHFKI